MKEYKLLEIDFSMHNQEKEMNKLGLDGWKFVGATYKFLVMEREIEKAIPITRVSENLFPALPKPMPIPPATIPLSNKKPPFAKNR